MGDGRSDLFFDILKYEGGDTLRYEYYGLMKDVNNQRQILRLDTAQIYSISYKEHFP